LTPFIISLTKNFVNTGNPIFPIKIELPIIEVSMPGHFTAGEISDATSIANNLEKLPIQKVFKTIIRDIGNAGLFIFTIFIVLLTTLIIKINKLTNLDSEYYNLLFFYGIVLFLLISFVNLPFSALDTAKYYNFGLRLAIPLVAMIFCFWYICINRICWCNKNKNNYSYFASIESYFT
jgi:hypothetical protein